MKLADTLDESKREANRLEHDYAAWQGHVRLFGVTRAHDEQKGALPGQRRGFFGKISEEKLRRIDRG